MKPETVLAASTAVNLFARHNYQHEPLTQELVDAVLATGDPAAIKIALYAVWLEGALHIIAHHVPPKGLDELRKVAHRAIHPDEEQHEPSQAESSDRGGAVEPGASAGQRDHRHHPDDRAGGA